MKKKKILKNSTEFFFFYGFSLLIEGRDTRLLCWPPVRDEATFPSVNPPLS